MEKVAAAKLSNDAHVALNYALAETRGGKYATRWHQTLGALAVAELVKPPSARISRSDLMAAIGRGLKELGDLHLVDFRRSATGEYEPVAVHLDRIESGALILGDLS